MNTVLRLHALAVAKRSAALCKGPAVWTRNAGVARLHNSARLADLQKFTMPAMSPTMEDGGIASWKKNEGDAFQSGDETDKATMEVEAQDDGVLAKIVMPAGSKHVPVNSTIAIIAEEGDDLSGADELAKQAEKESASAASSSGSEDEPAEKDKGEEEPKKQKDAPAPAPPKPDTSAQKSSNDAPIERIFATPIARRLAQERGIPLRDVKGTGPEGRILKEDIEKFTGSSAAASGPAAPAEASYTDVPLSNMRRTIAKRLTESKTSVPDYYVSVDIDMDKVNQLRSLFNRASAERINDAEKARAAKLSVNDFLIKAAAIALQQVPAVNSSWHGDFIREHQVQDISMAVSTPNGLITPIVRNAGAIGLAGISAQSKSLAVKARDGKLKPEEYQGGTFTISNMGMMGVSNFTAIINPPQSCILAIGATQDKIVPDDASEKGWRKAPIMTATISSDHRVVDGATSAQWMQAFKNALENPLSFML
ncbi:Lat1p [Malassezia vespertilionis]|uniref:Dihydrolipoyllysine-residue acetyltransferase component of pyruvate dehydrogenase complex, mitochondrial n=1 Tax=Malassezia vespertilionis TaxID=2020962 RepID=A0A2N1JHA8_9BASI|nr:Lat1p [Malassezia vespertilionis]